MLPALGNFVSYGAQTMIQTPPYIEAVASMVRDIFRDEKVGGMDRIYGCKLAEAIMLNLRGHVDQYIPPFVDLAMTVLLNDELKVKSYRVHLMEMVINAIYYNPVLALRVTESKGWTNKFFSQWFSNIESFTRVHDKKLSILAITGLLTLRAEDVPSSVQQGWPRLLQGVVRLFQTLPAALKSRSRDRCSDQGSANFLQIGKKLSRIMTFNSTTTMMTTRMRKPGKRREIGTTMVTTQRETLETRALHTLNF